jgi:hypothetical protein
MRCRRVIAAARRARSRTDFAGLPVSDYQRALTWYERLLGSGPAFFPNAAEAVWELAEHRYFYIEELPDRAGYALHTVFVAPRSTTASATSTARDWRSRAT